jgi:hypothetical protein
VLKRYGVLCICAAAVTQAQDPPDVKDRSAPQYWTGDKAYSAPMPLVAVTPCRLLDTRNEPGHYGAPSLVAGVERTFVVGVQCGVAANAAALSINVTVTNTLAAGFVSLYPEGSLYPGTSSVSYMGASETVANSAVVALGPGGFTAVAGVSGTDIIVDVNGYFAPQKSVSTVNSLTGEVALVAGPNITLAVSGNAVTIATGPGGGIPTGAAAQTLRSDGLTWVASSALTNDGKDVGISGNLMLPATGPGGDAGVLSLGGYRFLHHYGTADTSANTFVGSQAGNFTMTGHDNTGIGTASLLSNATAHNNTAMGSSSLRSNTTGTSNTASGFQSLFSNTEGHYNTAIGHQSLTSNTTGHQNTAGGDGSLYHNTTGYYSTASGVYSLYHNTTGYANTATGHHSLVYNTTGHHNTAIGSNAGTNNGSGYRNTFVGASADVTGTGYYAYTNATAVGFGAQVDAPNHIRLGNEDVNQIGGHVGWTNLSDARRKGNILDLLLGLDFVLALRPVSFTLTNGDGRTDMGFLAQDVEALLGASYSVLGIGGDADRTLSLRYTDFIAPIVRAMQEQQATIENQSVRIDGLVRDREALLARIEALEARGGRF